MSEAEKVARRLEQAAKDCEREANATDSFGFTNVWLAQAHQCRKDAATVRSLARRGRRGPPNAEESA